MNKLTIPTQGNITSYVTSYLRIYDPTLTYEDTLIIYASQIVMQAIIMPFGGMLLAKFGPKLASILGAILVTSGVTLSSQVTTVPMMVCTYGLMFGAGTGLSYTAPIFSSQKFFPNKKGQVAGMVTMGFGAGALIFNQVTTAFVNPKNVKCSIVYEGAQYFDRDIADNVPAMFLLLATCFASLMLIGCILVKEPETSQLDEQLLGMHDEEGEMSMDGINGSSSVDTDAQNGDMHPLKTIQHPQFSLLWLMYLMTAMGGVYVVGNYKSIAGGKFTDDKFLATVGSVMSVFNGLARLFWGAFADKFSFPLAIRTLSFLLGAILFTLWPVGTNLGEFGFLVWCSVTMATFGGIFALFPTAVLEFFGKKYAGVNFGIAFSSMAVTSLLIVFGAKSLTHIIGYSGMLNIVATMAWCTTIGSFFVKNPRSIVNKEPYQSKHSFQNELHLSHISAGNDKLSHM